YASAAELSLFRRPLPSTNLKFLSTVMWDGRETFKDATSQDCIAHTATCFATLHFELIDQSTAATTGHAQAANALTTEQREAIVAFEMTLFTAQITDDEAGHLAARHANGGPEYLSWQPFYFGINDVVSGDYQTGAAFSSKAFELYAGWLSSADHDDDGHGGKAARAAVARRRPHQGPGAARSRRPRAVLSQRLRERSRCGRRLLQRSLRARSD